MSMPTPPPPDYQGYATAFTGNTASVPWVQALVDQALAQGWSVGQLETAILNSPQFEQMFPGIKRPDGSLRMNATEYRQLAEVYYNVGQDYGLGIGRDQVGW